MVVMSTTELQYTEPVNLKEAIMILSKVEGAKILAGGTDVIVSMREGKIAPKHIVNIKKIPRLDTIDSSKDGELSLGALVTIGAIETSALVRKAFPMIADAAHQLGSLPVRNRATLGGNLCNSSPSADLAPPLIALGATVKIVGPKGRRSVKLEDFFIGPGKTVLSKSEILTGLKVPKPPENSYGVFLKHGPRQCMDIATVNAAVMVTLKGKICKDAKIVLGAVAPIPMRAKQAEEEIRGRPLEVNVIHKAGQSAAKECIPISDVRGSAEYRREIVNALVTRLLQKAMLANSSK